MRRHAFVPVLVGGLMKYALMKKVISGYTFLVAADLETENRIKKLSLLKEIIGDFVVPRNNKFHRKYFALVKAAFQMWDAPSSIKIPQKDRLTGKSHMQVLNLDKDSEGFRNWLTIKAGYYRILAMPNGDIEFVAKSIRFDKMEPDEFEKLYNATITVILNDVLPKDDDYREALEKAILEFA